MIGGQRIQFPSAEDWIRLAAYFDAAAMETRDFIMNLSHELLDDEGLFVDVYDTSKTQMQLVCSGEKTSLYLSNSHLFDMGLCDTLLCAILLNIIFDMPHPPHMQNLANFLIWHFKLGAKFVKPFSQRNKNTLRSFGLNVI